MADTLASVVTPGTRTNTVAACPGPGSPGALESAISAASDARDSIRQLPAGSPPWRQAQERLSHAKQCLRTLREAGLTSARSRELIEETGTEVR
jgi:hypothetical protein